MLNFRFGKYKFETMTDLKKAERIVINSCECRFCLSDRVPIETKQKTINDYLRKEATICGARLFND